MKIYLNKKECRFFKDNKSIKKIENNSKKLYRHWLLNPLFPGELIQDAYINCRTGALISINNYTCTDFIEIPEGVKIISVVNDINNMASYHVFSVYDENKNFIKGSYKDTAYDWNFAIPTGEDHLDFEMPENAKYIRLSSSSDGSIVGCYYWSEISNAVKFVHESDKTYNVNTVADLKALNVKTGDVVTTQGYNSVGDLGNATYDIMTYDEFQHLLPGDIKVMKINSTSPVINTPVDEHGNHTLNNGLVAKIRLDGEIRPEQWGAIAEESFNSCQAFVHMFAHVKTGTIRLKKDGTYCLGLIYEDDIVSNHKDNPYKAIMCGGLLGGQLYGKPIMANIHNVEIIGDNSLITNKAKTFGNNGMGMLNFGGIVHGLKFDGVNFDGKGRTMGTDNKNSNHIIFYCPASFVNMHPVFKDMHPLYDEKTNSYPGGYVQDMEVTNCIFKDAGAMYRQAGDWGGDHILIINPPALDNLNIHHNRFESWGRWVLAIDLGGYGECLTNIKFDDNECIGASAVTGETNEDGTPKYMIDMDKNEFKVLYPNYNDYGLELQLDKWRWRALGMIDFEAKKCFADLSFQRNRIIGTAGWAINGCSRINRDFVIRDNYYDHQGGGYPYAFSCYSGITQDWLVENNVFPGRGDFAMGYFTNGMTFRNNVGLSGIRTFGLAGDIIIEDNSQGEYGNGITIVWSHESNNYDDPQFPLEKVIADGGVNITYRNNEGSLVAKFTDQEDIQKTAFFKYDIEFTYPIERANVIEFTNQLTINPNIFKNAAQTITFKGTRLSEPIENIYALKGMYYVEKGQVFATNCQNFGVVGGDFFKNKFIENFQQYNNCNWGAYALRHNLSKISIVCTETGYYPGECEYGFPDLCTHISYILNNGTVGDNVYVNTDDDIYWVTVKDKDGKASSTTTLQVPTHKEGFITYQDADEKTIKMHYIGKVMKAELVVE